MCKPPSPLGAAAPGEELKEEQGPQGPSGPQGRGTHDKGPIGPVGPWGRNTQDRGPPGSTGYPGVRGDKDKDETGTPGEHNYIHLYMGIQMKLLKKTEKRNPACVDTLYLEGYNTKLNGQ